MVQEDAPHVEAIEVRLNTVLVEGVAEQQSQKLQYRKLRVVLKPTKVNADKQPQELRELVNVAVKEEINNNFITTVFFRQESDFIRKILLSSRGEAVYYTVVEKQAIIGIYIYIYTHNSQ